MVAEHSTTTWQRLNQEAIPAELRAETRWVTWRSERRDGKPTKVPYIAGTPRRAQSNNPTTWSTFETALAACQAGAYDGGGFMLGDGYVGLDFDGCRDPETGEIAAWARPSLDLLLHRGAYVEISPSGTGVKAILRGVWSASWHKRVLAETPLGDKDKAAVEVYDAERYFTVTGWPLAPGSPAQIVDAQDLLDAIATAFAPPERSTSDPTLHAAGGLPPLMDDAAIVMRAYNAKNGPAFSALYDRGDTAPYNNDDSAADLALCAYLSFYTPDAAQIERIFRHSALYREKWERADYRARTIARALERTAFYTPPSAQDETPDEIQWGEAAAEGELDEGLEMVTIPRARFAALLALQQDNEELRRERDYLKARTVSLTRDAEFGAYARKASTDERLKPGPTRIITALAAIVGVPPADGGYTEPKLVRRGLIATKTGLSPSTISLNLPDIERLGTIKVDRRPVMRTRTHTSKKGQTYDATEEEFDLWISLGPLPSNSLTAEQVKDMAQRAKAEAERKHCPHCGGTRLVVDRLRCLDCDHVCTPEEAKKTRRRPIHHPPLESGGGDDAPVRGDVPPLSSGNTDAPVDAAAQTVDPLWNPARTSVDTPLWNPEGVPVDRPAGRSHVYARPEDSPNRALCPGGCDTWTWKVAGQVQMCGPCQERAASAAPWDTEEATNCLAAFYQRCIAAAEGLPEPWPALAEEEIEAACEARDRAALGAAIAAAEVTWAQQVGVAAHSGALLRDENGVPYEDV